MSLPRTIGFALVLLTLSNTTNANECLSKMPAGVQAAGPVKLCESRFSGLNAYYSCQDYHGQSGTYRVLYKGGLAPRAILKISARGKEQLIYSPSWGDHRMNCPLPAPDSISRHAQHRGLGICLDEQDTAVPCSVYEHASARQSQAWRYLVFYQANGHTQVAHRMPVRDNHDAMVAEIAYQFGLSLLETECCSEQATIYLGHAHRLFPKVAVYRAGYLDALLQQLAANEK